MSGHGVVAERTRIEAALRHVPQEDLRGRVITWTETQFGVTWTTLADFTAADAVFRTARRSVKQKTQIPLLTVTRLSLDRFCVPDLPDIRVGVRLHGPETRTDGYTLWPGWPQTILRAVLGERARQQEAGQIPAANLQVSVMQANQSQRLNLHLDLTRLLLHDERLSSTGWILWACCALPIEMLDELRLHLRLAGRGAPLSAVQRARYDDVAALMRDVRGRDRANVTVSLHQEQGSVLKLERTVLTHQPVEGQAAASSPGENVRSVQGRVLVLPDGRTGAVLAEGFGHQLNPELVLLLGPCLQAWLHGAGGHLDWNDHRNEEVITFTPDPPGTVRMSFRSAMAPAVNVDLTLGEAIRTVRDLSRTDLQDVLGRSGLGGTA